MRNIREDYQKLTGKPARLHRIALRAISDAGFRAVVFYRAGRWLRRHHLAGLAALAERMGFHLCHCIVSTNAEIGPGFVIRHPGDVIVGTRAKIGAHCEIRQGVTIGGNAGREKDGRSQPVIGDDVQIGAGAKVVGPILVGNCVCVGANAVVERDVPSNCVVAGVPARVIRLEGRAVPVIEQDGSMAELLRTLTSRIEHLEKRLAASGSGDFAQSPAARSDGAEPDRE